MSLLESLTIAVRSLCVNKLRSALTALGIIVGVAAVVCMISVGAGAQADVAEKIRTLGANLLVVMPGAQSSGGARLETGTQATSQKKTLRRSVVNSTMCWSPHLCLRIPHISWHEAKTGPQMLLGLLQTTSLRANGVCPAVDLLQKANWKLGIRWRSWAPSSSRSFSMELQAWVRRSGLEMYPSP